jgi:hypothetical protein
VLTLGKKGFAKRIRQAVVQQLEPGEEIVVDVYVRGERGTVRRALFGALADASISAFIVSLTNRRMLVFQMDKFRAQNSKLLFTVPRENVRLVGSDLSGFQGQMTLDLGQGNQSTLIVQRAWIEEAKAFQAALPAA